MLTFALIAVVVAAEEAEPVVAAPDDARQRLTHACVNGDAAACEQAASLADQQGQSQVATQLRLRALELRGPPADAEASSAYAYRPRPKPPVMWRPWPVMVAGAGLAAGGWAVGLLTWVGNLVCGLANWSSRSGTSACSWLSGWLLVPQVGPWIALGSGELRGGWVSFAAVLGTAQVVGLVALICGVAIKVPIRQDVAVNVVPTSNGLALGGTF